MDLFKTCLVLCLVCTLLAHTVLSAPYQDFDITDSDWTMDETDPAMFSKELSRERREAEGTAPGLLKRLRRYVQIHVMRENHMRNSRRRGRNHRRRHRPYGGYRRYEIAHS